MTEEHRQDLMRELVRVGQNAQDDIRGGSCKKPCTCCGLTISPSSAYDACRLALKVLREQHDFGDDSDCKHCGAYGPHEENDSCDDNDDRR